MKEKLKDIIDSAKLLLGAGTLFAGSIFCSEATGLTEAYVKYSDVCCQVYYEAHKKAPWLVWGDYGNPNENKEARLSWYRVGANIDVGLCGLMIGAMGIGIVSETLERKKRTRKVN